jgi:hypothetical protein
MKTLFARPLAQQTQRAPSRWIAVAQVQMQATESPLIHDGGNGFLATGSDARNSTITGTTLAGPNGSGQFLAVYLSTARTYSFVSTTTVNLSTVAIVAGLLQNKPAGGQAADVGIFGLSKAVSGSSAVSGGQALMISSTNAGVLVPWATGGGRPFAMAYENATAVGAVFTVFLPGPAVGLVTLST